MNKEFYFYKKNNKYLFSRTNYKELDQVSEDEIKAYPANIFYLNPMDILKTRKTFSISSPSQLFIHEEDLSLLLEDEKDYDLDLWLREKINNRQVRSINTNYPNWEDLLEENTRDKWKVNIVALGDVGSNLAIGLRLLGGENLSEIGLYDRDSNRLNRWYHELNQVIDPSNKLSFPKVTITEKEDLFDCQMFIFCASRGIPSLDSNVKDVRMAQLESNSEIISSYARLARENNFKGIFAVVSDPVDLLCKVALLESNKDLEGNFDYKGLSPDQIVGYGLGVMNARAIFYSMENKESQNYINEGRVFGPHGQGLIVANSLENYNKDLSDYLTHKTINANKEVRAFGYKPFIAPSLSSGALSIIATINGSYFYGSSLIKDVYMGARMKLNETGIELEQNRLPDALFENIKETYEKLAMII